MQEDAARQRRKFDKKWLALIVAALIAAFGLGVFFAKNHNPKAAAPSYFPSWITRSQMTIPVYYPVNLPSGYAVSTFKIVKQNIMTFVVSDPSGAKYYMSEQSLPSNFDFVAFQKKFPQPDQYSTPIGQVLAGVSGTQLVGSIQTDKNVWIILNSANNNSQKNLETITRSLQQVSLN